VSCYRYCIRQVVYEPLPWHSSRKKSKKTQNKRTNLRQMHRLLVWKSIAYLVFNVLKNKPENRKFKAMKRKDHKSAPQTLLLLITVCIYIRHAVNLGRTRHYLFKNYGRRTVAARQTGRMNCSSFITDVLFLSHRNCHRGGIVIVGVTSIISIVYRYRK
jgi:hypothetical protein